MHVQIQHEHLRKWLKYGIGLRGTERISLEMVNGSFYPHMRFGNKWLSIISHRGRFFRNTVQTQTLINIRTLTPVNTRMHVTLPIWAHLKDWASRSSILTKSPLTPSTSAELRTRTLLNRFHHNKPLPAELHSIHTPTVLSTTNTDNFYIHHQTRDVTFLWE